MKYLLLILLLLTTTLFAGRHYVDQSSSELVVSLSSIEAKISWIDARILDIPAEIAPIQGSINAKTSERDALPVGDPQTFALQEEIDALVIQRNALQGEEIYLNSDRISKLESKRQVLWYQRAMSVPDLRLAMKHANLQQPNSKALVKTIVESKDEAKLISLENATPQVVAELQDDAINEGIKKRFKCSEKVKLKMFKLNYGKNLKKPQVKKFVKDFGDIKNLIDTGSLESAREDILAIAPDGVIVKAEDITALVAEIDSCK